MAMMLMVMIKVNGSSIESLPAIMEENKVGHHCNALEKRFPETMQSVPPKQLVSPIRNV